MAEATNPRSPPSRSRQVKATLSGTDEAISVKGTKMRDKLRSGQEDESPKSRHLDKDKHDEILYDNDSGDEAPTKTTPMRRSARKAGSSQPEPAGLQTNIPLRPRAAKAVVEPPKSQYPPFKDRPESSKPWPKALVYPSTGPNRATVDFEDLHRLDDEQLLNDNLVQFGIKFAQELYPGLNDKIYVFNTYFYTSLTGGPPKAITYDAVKRWTAKIDIFQYDHVVVPINQR